ncbi:unnamed protein product, partial [Orchesella dallaii]
ALITSTTAFEIQATPLRFRRFELEVLLIDDDTLKLRCVELFISGRATTPPKVEQISNLDTLPRSCFG